MVFITDGFLSWVDFSIGWTVLSKNFIFRSKGKWYTPDKPRMNVLVMQSHISHQASDLLKLSRCIKKNKKILSVILSKCFNFWLDFCCYVCIQRRMIYFFENLFCTLVKVGKVYLFWIISFCQMIGKHIHTDAVNSHFLRTLPYYTTYKHQKYHEKCIVLAPFVVLLWTVDEFFSVIDQKLLSLLFRIVKAYCSVHEESQGLQFRGNLTIEYKAFYI